MITRLCAALVLTWAAAPPVQAGTPRQAAAVEAAARAALPEFIDFLKIPNVAHQPGPHMRRNADWAEAAFRKRGFSTRQLEDGDTPMVFAEFPGAAAGARTVLFYAHMDGQAAFPKEWSQPDPFAPVLRARGADGALRDLPIERLTAGPVDPEWRLFGRSTADDKGPILMLLAAMDAVKAQGETPAIRVKVILDSHEEGGPPTLKDVVAANAELLKADAVVMLDGPMHDTNRPTLVFGHRGGAGFSLTVFGAPEELHSGHYGNFAPNPAFGLAALIASMKDADGRVLIPGFYEGVATDAASVAARAAVPDDEAALKARLGIARTEALGANYQEAMAYPTLNVTEMKAGEPGSRRSIIPAFATASFDSRTVPGTPPARQLALVKAWVEAQGYHLVDGEPTAEERATYPLLASVKGGGGAPALQTPLDAPVGVWARKALVNEFGEEPVRIPIMGGGVPTKPLIDGLHAPILLIPLVNRDNNQHAANENLRMGNYFDGVRSLRALVMTGY